ncbi:phage major capsid protein [Paenibacillus sp. J5C_2022]|uniref:phage major capsid protein n=1 Tax=Paenibacillus sp. J5C2022 TaxID=2977129 RepID=UPI0021D01E01|nr:phage major capsid protein [Paenibacillus sp. J5C2022]MCU6709407.1 phage major capsid protein [Paenibacillus sp. J5C2022]
MKKIDEMKQQLESMKVEAQAHLDKNEVTEAKAKIEEVKSMKEAIAIQEALDAEHETEITNKMNKDKGDDTQMKDVKQTANAMRAIIKASMGKQLTEAENALLVPATGDGTNGEGFILPKDIRTLIQEKIRQYKSLRDITGYYPTTALTGSFPVEDVETFSELVDFTDGTDGTEPTDIKFKNVAFALKQKGAILALSNTLLKMTDNALIQYIAGVFAKKAVVTENKMAIAKIEAAKTKKAIADWKALKKSINVDLDEGVKYGAAIVTNQDGWNVLDEAVDLDGHPVLQPDPTNATRKLFAGLPVHVYSNAMIPTVDDAGTLKAPVYYGNLSEAIKFVDTNNYAFATSEHAGFTKNVTYARVIENVDVIQVDSSDKMYIVGSMVVTA